MVSGSAKKKTENSTENIFNQKYNIKSIFGFSDEFSLLIPFLHKNNNVF